MLNSTYWEFRSSGSEGRRWKQAYGSRTEHRSDSDGTRTGPYGHRATSWPYHSYFRMQNPDSVSVTLDQSMVRLRIGREPVVLVRHPERLGRRPVNSEALSRIDDNRAAPFYPEVPATFGLSVHHNMLSHCNIERFLRWSVVPMSWYTHCFDTNTYMHHR